MAKEKAYEEWEEKCVKLVLVKEGTYDLEEMLTIECPISIYGAGQDITIFQRHGIRIKGKKDQHCTFFDLTIQKTEEKGLSGDRGMSFDCRRVKFDKCGTNGVYAGGTKGRLTNCQVTHCKYSGIVSWGPALIELEGSQTKVHGNITNANPYEDRAEYGLQTSGSSGTIHLLFPLTKESVSTNNFNDKNYGSFWGGNGRDTGVGTIDTVTSFLKTTADEMAYLDEQAAAYNEKQAKRREFLQAHAALADSDYDSNEEDVDEGHPLP